MKRRFAAMLMVMLVLVCAIGCSLKTPDAAKIPSTSEIPGTPEPLYPEAQSTMGPVSSVWKSDKAGTLTLYEGNFVKVEFTKEYEFLLENYGNDSRTFANNTEYRCNFFVELNEASMEDATSFYIWFINGAKDYNLQCECNVEGDTMMLHVYWPYDSGELIFTRAS